MTRVLVTRARDDSARLVAALERAGLDVCLCPLVRTEQIETAPIDVAGFDWLVFTSRAGVRHGMPRVTGALPSVAAVGPGTAAALEDAGVEATLVPPVHNQMGLVDALGDAAGSILFLGAEEAGRSLVERLGAEHVAVYRTVDDGPAEVPAADLAVLASGSAARALARRRTDIPCVSIGPSTTVAAEESGLSVLSEAASSELDGLVDAVRLAASRLP